MGVFKCKMCGGSLEIRENQTTAVCEYCGTTQTLPRLEDERRANLYDRANHFRRNNEFDKAMGIYEKILNEDSTDAEAYWSLVLCRYGIEYVEDPATHKRVPTVNRAQFTSIFDDEDYKSALQYADNSQKAIYQAEAEAINEIQKGILSISQQEEPFDVFICYKETDDAQGRRTPDSVLANDLYHQLTQEGFKVFFSRITLEDKLGTAYEPYIFAALNSAKVMVVIGTKPEYFNAVWVKNEWSRYLALIKSGAKKVLIPAYRDMDPYDLPEEFSHLQAQDMSKLGFMQDLIRGIKKLTDKSPQTMTAKEVPQTQNRGDAHTLLRRAQIFLEDREWEIADEYFEKVLDLQPECAEAYFGKLLVDARCVNISEFKRAYQQQPRLQEETRVACPQETERINKVVQSYEIENYITAESIVAKFNALNRTYTSVTGSWLQALKEKESMLKQNKLLSRAMRYASGDFSKQLQEMVGEILTYYQKSLQTSQEKDKKASQQVQDCYKKQLRELEEAYSKTYQKVYNEMESYYQKAHQLLIDIRKEKISSPQRLIEAGKKLNQVSYELEKRSAHKGCKQLIPQFREEANARFKRESNTRKVKSCISRLILAVIVLTAIVIGALVYANNLYSQAEALLIEGEYSGAIEMFEKLGKYRGASERAMDIRYTLAEGYLQSGEYDLAIETFEKLENYKDSMQRVLEAKEEKYIQAQDYLDMGKKFEAAVCFLQLGQYKDAASRSLEIWAQITQRETISAAPHTVGITAEGRVVAKGSNNQERCDTYGWKDIIAVSAGLYHTIGLKSNGRVVAVGWNNEGQCEVSQWCNVVSISAGAYHTAGIMIDGTVVAVGSNDYGQCEVSNWKDITAISAGGCPGMSHTVGLQSNGTVVAVGDNSEGQCEVSQWSDIMAISAGGKHTVGLKSDGTVVAVGNNNYGQCEVSQWSDIVAISAGFGHTVGLKSDGTVVAVGKNEDEQCDVSHWSDIVAVSAGNAHTVGLKSDGTVVAVGWNENGQCDVSDWTDIRIPQQIPGE